MLDVTNTIGLKGRIELWELETVASQPLPRNCTNEEALGFANFMGKAMPTGQGMDFDIWVSDATLIFSEYPFKDVKIAVQHPTKGIRASHTWLPDPKTLIEFLRAMQERRGLIKSNARKLANEIIEEQNREPDKCPEEWVAMSRRIQNIVRASRGNCSLEQEEQRRSQQEEFNEYAKFRGDGDWAKGIEILLEEGTETAPENWRTNTQRAA